jgi:hypothetical protein
MLCKDAGDSIRNIWAHTQLLFCTPLMGTALTRTATIALDPTFESFTLLELVNWFSLAKVF